MATVNFIKYKRQSAGALSGVTQYVSQEEKIREVRLGETMETLGRIYHQLRELAEQEHR